jgi:hypothetical protein
MDSSISLPFPPWNASPDETRVFEPDGFASFDEVLQTLVASGDGRIIELRYWISKDWGRILRAKIILADNPTTHLVNCWYAPDSEVAIATTIEDNWES